MCPFICKGLINGLEHVYGPAVNTFLWLEIYVRYRYIYPMVYVIVISQTQVGYYMRPRVKPELFIVKSAINSLYRTYNVSQGNTCTFDVSLGNNWVVITQEVVIIQL